MTTPPKTDTKINHGMPGSSWSSKKFREEYDRAMDNLVDKNWDGGELFLDRLERRRVINKLLTLLVDIDMKYGDPLLPK